VKRLLVVVYPLDLNVCDDGTLIQFLLWGNIQRSVKAFTWFSLRNVIKEKQNRTMDSVRKSIIMLYPVPRSDSSAVRGTACLFLKEIMVLGRTLRINSKFLRAQILLFATVLLPAVMMESGTS
jgi:hypothetical protein